MIATLTCMYVRDDGKLAGSFDLRPNGEDDDRLPGARSTTIVFERGQCVNSNGEPLVVGHRYEFQFVEKS